MPMYASQFFYKRKIGEEQNGKENSNETQECESSIPTTDVNDSTNIMIAGGINRTIMVTGGVDN